MCKRKGRPCNQRYDSADDSYDDYSDYSDETYSIEDYSDEGTGFRTAMERWGRS